MSKLKKSIEAHLTVKDRLLSQDRWSAFLIVLGLFAIGVFVWEVQHIEQLSTKKESPKQELQAISQSY